jgi:hypothetical protein
MLLTPVRTILLTPDEWTMLNNIVLTTFIKHVSSTLLTLVPSCCNNYSSFIKREQVVGTMLLTIVAWTMLFSHDDNILINLYTAKNAEPVAQQDWTMFCCPRCSHLSTILNNVVEPESGVTILFNIVDSYEQCGQQNIVQCMTQRYFDVKRNFMQYRL